MRLYVVRHAKAGDRGRWDGPDDLRPLTTAGRRQAEGLVSLLEGQPIDRISSSPFVRCVQTVEPLARARGIPIVHEPTLTEGEGAWAVMELVRSGADDGTVLCTHGDVIMDLLDRVRRDGVDVGRHPPLQKGSTWVLEASGGRFLDPEYLPPPR